jgi:hypothetical protein
MIPSSRSGPTVMTTSGPSIPSRRTTRVANREPSSPVRSPAPTGAMLYGVRFGPTTRYCVLDIDKGSAYHPTRDRFAWRRLVAALEVLGLVQAVVCTSSYSGGLHLYFPFDTEQKTWAIALAVSTLLENSGLQTSTRSAGSLSQLQSLCHQWRAQSLQRSSSADASGVIPAESRPARCSGAIKPRLSNTGSLPSSAIASTPKHGADSESRTTATVPRDW